MTDPASLPIKSAPKRKKKRVDNPGRFKGVPLAERPWKALTPTQQDYRLYSLNAEQRITFRQRLKSEDAAIAKAALRETLAMTQNGGAKPEAIAKGQKAATARAEKLTEQAIASGLGSIPATAAGMTKLEKLFDAAVKQAEAMTASVPLADDATTESPPQPPAPLPTREQVRERLNRNGRLRLDPEAVLIYTLAPAYFATGLGFDPEPWQSDILNSMKTRVGVLAARQSGKSLTIAYKAGCFALCNPASTVLVISPTLRQSTELLLKVAGVFSRAGLRILQQSQFSITLADRQPGAHSRVIALPGSAEDEGASVRGYTADLLILEEASFLEQVVISTVLPSIAARPKAQLMAISSAGLVGSWFESVMTDPNSGYEKHVIPADKSGRFSPAQIEELRKTQGATFDREMMCIFSTVGDGIFDADTFAAAFGPKLDEFTKEPEADEPVFTFNIDEVFGLKFEKRVN